ncbi:MAG TPA: mannosyltransferase family protein [Ktedonobacteraceae bacterium]|nr:mannosyltransferase family protein [Ktedonobacteraceae bacterium]
MDTKESTTGSTRILSGEPVTDVQQPWRIMLTPWWQATLAILPAFLISRIIFLLLGYLGGVLFSVPNYWPGTLTFRDMLYLWYQWDVARYATIAMQGYPGPGYAAFFPLFPALSQALNTLLHLDILETMMLISNVAFLGTLIVFYRLVETEIDSETAKRAALYFSIFPSAFFFFVGYNESLFMLFLLLSFYALRHSRWWLAGLFGGLAVLTRSIGLLLAAVFLYEFLRQKLLPIMQAWQEGQRWASLRLCADLLPVLFIPLGLGIYAFGLYMRFGDPLAFSHAEANWRVGLSFPWVAPAIAIHSLLTLSAFTFATPHIYIDLFALALFSGLLVLAVVGPERLRRDQWSFVLFGLLALIYSVIFPGTPGYGNIPYDPLPSVERFVLEIFVGFIILARLGRRPWFHQLYLLFALPLLAFLLLQFITGHWTV